MKKGTCLKCGSKDVYVGVYQAFRCGEYFPHLEAFKDWEQNNLLLLPYVCTACGYVEFHVDVESLQKMPVLIEDKEFWHRVA